MKQLFNAIRPFSVSRQDLDPKAEVHRGWLRLPRDTTLALVVDSTARLGYRMRLLFFATRFIVLQSTRPGISTASYANCSGVGRTSLVMSLALRRRFALGDFLAGLMKAAVLGDRTGSFTIGAWFRCGVLLDLLVRLWPIRDELAFLTALAPCRYASGT